MTRTLQYFKQQMDNGEITFEDILHKYNHELHANEIVLLSYYIASINIEAVFDEVNGPERGYEPFEGIVLTDTFESTERENSFMDELLCENNKRLKKQQEQPITAIISNPPYSAGQKNANDDNQNIRYEKLEESIQKTYANNSKANLSKGTYDSYVKAFRWATDRLTDKGVIGFVTNGSFLDNKSTDGLRASLYQDFNHLYIFNLRGNARTSGEQRRKEKDNVFGQGTRTTITISILIKDGTDDHEIHYHDIGDYLTRKAKLNTIKEFSSINGIDWDKITPDDNNDWINQRDPNYQNYVSIVGDEESPFLSNAPGVSTNRDIWVSGFSKEKMIKNTEYMVDNYNEAVRNKKTNEPEIDDTKIKWTVNLNKKYINGQKINVNRDNVTLEMYRPFTKKWLYYDEQVIERPGQFRYKWGKDNLVLVTTGRSSSKGFSVLLSNKVLDIQLMMNGQSFMRYDNSNNESLLQGNSNMNELFADKLGLSIDNTFAYVYGLLNSKEYQTKYANDLKKDLARIPIVKYKKKYVEIGKKLMDLHLNYEEVPMYEGASIESKNDPSYKVKKMKFAKVRNAETGKLEKDRSTIIFNTDITIKNIPEKAYEYIVNGKSAIEWIMDQYQVKTDKKSGITDDPNDFSDDPKYIFNLLLRIINVSVQTVDLVNSLPKLEIIE